MMNYLNMRNYMKGGMKSVLKNLTRSTNNKSVVVNPTNLRK
jgi:hypothetical protein